MVERDGDALITQVGEDDEGVFQAVMGEAVRIITPQHGVPPLKG
jgi:hypothetical protein